MSKKQNAKNYQAGEWKDAAEIIRNKNTKRVFGGWGETSLAEILRGASDQDYESADRLWTKLKEAFNKEAKNYDPETNMSRLGSIGDKNDREVMRSAWWKALSGDNYGEYEMLTDIIEILHQGEQLETGRINFGS